MQNKKIKAFIWNEQFVTGLDTVDEQHLRLVTLTNQFGRHLSKGSDVESAVVEKTIAELIDYTRYHFSEEEQMMQERKIDPRHFAHHRAEHERFLKEVMHLKQSMGEKESEAERALFKFLTHWLAYHILGDDQVMARQLTHIREGLTPEQAYEQVSRAAIGATGPLLEALNGLFRQVSERNRRLMELNRTLEEKVQERTRELFKANQHLDELAHTDSLTGLPNRRHAMNQLSIEWNKAQPQPLLCIMIDADGFKQVNDRFGHDAGDQVLKELAKKLRNAFRTDDFVARLGGDEFMVILCDTPLEQGKNLAEQVRELVNRMSIELDGGQWQGSISMGLASADNDMLDQGDLLKAADQAVYRSKRQGRNQLNCHDAAMQD